MLCHNNKKYTVKNEHSIKDSLCQSKHFENALVSYIEKCELPLLSCCRRLQKYPDILQWFKSSGPARVIYPITTLKLLYFLQSKDGLINMKQNNAIFSTHGRNADVLFLKYFCSSLRKEACSRYF